MAGTLRFINSKNIGELKHNVDKNLHLYYSDNDFTECFKYSDYFIQTHIPLNCDLRTILRISNEAQHDIPNSIALYNALSHLSPEQASDIRLWIYLCHFDLKFYTKTRWLNSNEPKVEEVYNHFFVPSGIRGLIRDNGASRLWWMGNFANEVSKLTQLNPERVLEVLLFRTDVRASLLERTTSATNYKVSAAIIHLLNESYDNEQNLFNRETFRDFMKEVNSLGGYKLLDVLSISELEDEFVRILALKMGIRNL